MKVCKLVYSYWRKDGGSKYLQNTSLHGIISKISKSLHQQCSKYINSCIAYGVCIWFTFSKYRLQISAGGWMFWLKYFVCSQFLQETVVIIWFPRISLTISQYNDKIKMDHPRRTKRMYVFTNLCGWVTRMTCLFVSLTDGYGNAILRTPALQPNQTKKCSSTQPTVF
jgi:hypothetical protein